MAPSLASTDANIDRNTHRPMPTSADVERTRTCSGSYRSFRTRVSWAFCTARLNSPGIWIRPPSFSSVPGPPWLERTPASTVTRISASFAGMVSGPESTDAVRRFRSAVTVNGSDRSPCNKPPLAPSIRRETCFASDAVSTG